MAEPLKCPHCEKLLTDDQVRSLAGQMTNAWRKVKSGGKNGGRPRLSGVWPSEAGLVEVPEAQRSPEQRWGEVNRVWDAVKERVLAPFEDL